MFKQYVRAKNESGCKYFLYENNNSISQDIKDEISKHLGVQPMMINSSLLSAQNRKRCYWTNIPFEIPEDKGISLSDIVENGYVDRDKSLCVTRRYAGFQGSQSYLCRRYFGKSMGQAKFASKEDYDIVKKLWKENERFESQNIQIERLSVIEIERLQTLPDNYTECEGISVSQRIEAIGNGWTVDVIAHILRNIK